MVAANNSKCRLQVLPKCCSMTVCLMTKDVCSLCLKGLFCRVAQRFKPQIRLHPHRHHRCFPRQGWRNCCVWKPSLSNWNRTREVLALEICVYVQQASLLAKYKHSVNIGRELKTAHVWKQISALTCMRSRFPGAPRRRLRFSFQV